MKNNTIFSCSHCGAQFQKWIGRCLECGQWGTVEKAQMTGDEKKEATEYAVIKTVGLKEVEGKNTIRIKTNTEELDRVLGGGIVPGSLILLGGNQELANPL